MAYKLRWKKGNRMFQSGKSFSKKSVAEKKAKFIRQLDDDLPKSRRDKSLKTYRVVKVPRSKKITRRRTTSRIIRRK